VVRERLLPNDDSKTYDAPGSQTRSSGKDMIVTFSRP
jgi:hypothetical protein